MGLVVFFGYKLAVSTKMMSPQYQNYVSEADEGSDDDDVGGDVLEEKAKVVQAGNGDKVDEDADTDGAGLSRLNPALTEAQEIKVCPVVLNLAARGSYYSFAVCV